MMISQPRGTAAAMAEVTQIPAPNYSQIPNVLFDVWMPILGQSEFSVLMYIARLTFGFHQPEAQRGMRRIAEKTGMNKDTVSKSVESLIGRGLLTCKTGFRGRFIYEINVAAEKPECTEKPDSRVYGKTGQYCTEKPDTLKKPLKRNSSSSNKKEKTALETASSSSEPRAQRREEKASALQQPDAPEQKSKALFSSQADEDDEKTPSGSSRVPEQPTYAQATAWQNSLLSNGAKFSTPRSEQKAAEQKPAKREPLADPEEEMKARLRERPLELDVDHAVEKIEQTLSRNGAAKLRDFLEWETPRSTGNIRSVGHYIKLAKDLGRESMTAGWRSAESLQVAEKLKQKCPFGCSDGFMPLAGGGWVFCEHTTEAFRKDSKNLRTLDALTPKDFQGRCLKCKGLGQFIENGKTAGFCDCALGRDLKSATERRVPRSEQAGKKSEAA
jgi:Bacteriophage replication protein O